MARKYDAYDDYTTPASFLPEDSAVKNAAIFTYCTKLQHRLQRMLITLR
jgi:hypothetical protein